MSSFISRLVRTSAVVTTSLLLVTACGSDSKSSTSSSTPSTAVSDSSLAADTTPSDSDVTLPSLPPDDSVLTTDSVATDESTITTTDVPYSVETDAGTVTLKAKPVKIVSLAPTHTETLFAIGAGAQVIAVDDQSNYPADAKSVVTDLSGYTPNVEAIAGYKPDLVVISDDTSGIAAQLAAVNIPVWIGPAATSLDDVYTQIEQLGVLTGHSADAIALAGNMQSDIDTIIAELPDTEVPLSYYHELDNTYFSVTSNTFIGQIYSLAGLTNIADGAEADNDYPQLNSEFIISADPQLIFLADTKCCGESPATVAARDGWSDISAVKNNEVIAMDDDISSRWGPRVVDYLRAVVDAVKSASNVPAG